jgi:hypothetical protein
MSDVMPLNAKPRLAVVLASLLVMSSACASEPGADSKGSLTPLVSGDVDRARHALANRVGKEPSSTYSVAKSHCNPFDSCSDVVRREIVFEQSSGSPDALVHDISRVYCSGIKLDPWHCSNPYRLARFSAFDGLYVRLEGNISLESALRLMNYLNSACYRSALEAFPHVANVARLQARRMPTTMKEVSLGRYWVGIAENTGIYAALTIEDNLSQQSECPYRLVSADRRLVLP